MLIPASIIRSGFVLGLLLLTPAAADSPGAADAAMPDMACDTAEACFLAAAAFADAHPDDTRGQAQRFRHVRETYPETPWAGRAGLRAGWALLGHDPARALPYLRAARKDFPVLEDYVALQLGRALGRLGSAHDAAVMFDEAAALSAPSVLREEIRYAAGLAWFEDGQCRRADDRLRRAVSGDPDSRHAPRALYVRALCAHRLQRPADATRALREIWRRYPDSPEAHTVNEIVRSGRPPELRWTPSPEDYARRGGTWYGLARFDKAIRDLRTFVDARSGGQERAKAIFQLGMAHVRLKQYSRAASTFRRLTGTSSAYAGKAAVWLAKVYFRQGRDRRFLEWVDAATPTLSGNDLARIRWLRGVWAEDHHETRNARAAYEQVARATGLPRLRRRALWRMGWLQYQQGAWDAARDRFHALAAAVKDHAWQRRARYWHARTLERMGHAEEAQTRYRRVAVEWPMTYYGQLAHARLREPINADANRRARWEDRALALPASSKIRSNAHFQKARALALLGLCEDAAGEWSAVATRYRGRPRSLYAVARGLMECGAYDAAVSIAVRNFRDALERHRVPSDSTVWRMAYPSGYLPVIRESAPPHVDPLLVAGLIREESLYNPRALSPVGAMGLMQLMPGTANRIARRLKLGSVDRDDLFDVALNVRLGAYHVGEALEDFHGNPLHAVAAYNAGPDAVRRWIRAFGDRDPDEFVELISYKETRRYVKRVITSYRIYHYLYATPCSGFLLDRAC